MKLFLRGISSLPPRARYCSPNLFGNLIIHLSMFEDGIAPSSLTLSYDKKLMEPEDRIKSTIPHGNFKHGITVEYRAWKNMRQRCTYPKDKRWKDYGGRGIKVCDRWFKSFEDFLADVGLKPSPELTLERINNEGDYEPGNVKWADRFEQAHNRRGR